MLDADVGKIDVAIDDVGDDVADGVGAQMIGRRDHRQQIGTVRLEKPRSFIDSDILTGERAIESLRRRARHRSSAVDRAKIPDAGKCMARL